MTIDTDNILIHWKSTTKGLLSAGVAITLAIMALPPTASRCVITLAVLRALIGFFEQDAGKQLANVPGGGRAVVDSHEVPDDPKATPVVKQ